MPFRTAIKMRTMFNRVLQGFLVLLLLVPSGALGESLLYHCQMDGKVRRACCCPKVEVQAHTSPQLQCVGCCNIEKTENTSPTPAQRQHVFDPVSQSIASTLVLEDLHVLPGAVARHDFGLLPSRTGPPPFLRFCSFLI